MIVPLQLILHNTGNLTTGVINTSSNKVIVEKKIEYDKAVTKASHSVPLKRVGEKWLSKGSFLFRSCFQTLEYLLIWRQKCQVRDQVFLLREQIFIDEAEKRNVSGTSGLILLTALVKFQFLTIIQLGIHNKGILHWNYF